MIAVPMATHNPSNPEIYHPHMGPHSRSASVSSASSHSSHSRPTSATGSHPVVVPTMPPVAHDDAYRHFPLGLGRPVDPGSQSRHPSDTSQSTVYSNLITPIDSPPHGINVNIGKGHLPRSSHLRARAAASPYARDNESMYSSSSETEDLAMFLAQSHDYQGLYPPMTQHNYHPSLPPHHLAAQEPVGAFGRMTLSSDQTLEHLAANVRSATTTSSSDRAKQIFVQAWLNANYAPYPDGNVPRQGLYFSYRRVCDQYGIPHINTATLGKAIRLCFPTIKTRRLGVRGNSKYHYCGIRPATAAEAEFLQDYVKRTNNLAQQTNGTRSGSQDRQSGQEDDEDDEDSEGATASKRNSLALPGPTSQTLQSGAKNPKTAFDMDVSEKTPTANQLMSSAQQAAVAMAVQHKPGLSGHAPIRRQSTLGETSTLVSRPSPPSQAFTEQFMAPNQRSSVRQLSNFPTVEEALGPSSTSVQGQIAREVWGWFEGHLDMLLDSARNLKFELFEMHLRNFWQGLSGDHREVVHAPAMAGLMSRADAMVYDEILEGLRGQMLSAIPTAALTSLRQLAVQMEKALLAALDGYGNTFVEPKVELGARFGHLVLRFLDMFQVTQALATVLSNGKQLADMRRSWQNIDFESVRNQSALVCNCRHEDLMQLLESDFVNLLNGLSESTQPVRDVMLWADECCDRLMTANRNMGGEERTTMSSRSILIRWGYVTSQIMRDLTIRSDPAFGAFQILKLFLDDWISLTVLRAVALSTNSVAASVEPVMQQQFLSMSPMAAPDFVALDRASQGMLGLNTPTTTSMLAALNESFPTTTANGHPFSPTSFFMETSPTSNGDSFADFQPARSDTFDPTVFSAELALPTNPETHPSPKVTDTDKSAEAAPSVKSEPSTA